MAALGTVPERPLPPVRAELVPVTDYKVVRGKYLGEITERDPFIPLGARTSDLGTYIVRQIRVVYRQLWPNHGQRFPQ